MSIGGKRSRSLAIVVLAVLIGGCWSAEPPSPGGSFRFAVFGDGPYHPIEVGRAERVFAALSARPEAFVIHIGDIMWQRCTDRAYRERRELIERIGHPIVYTPGDNEWSDCVDLVRGEDPLERLASLRRVFFPDPARSLGASPLELESQALDAESAEFVENARWSHGGVLFATVHVIGGANGGRPFGGREARHDDEVERRTRAADARAVVVATALVEPFRFEPNVTPRWLWW